MVTEEKVRKTGEHRITDVCTDKSSHDYLVYHYLVPCIREAGQSTRGRLLDIGCGNKPYRSLFREVDDYVGCDITQSSENLVDVICPADNIPLPDSSFDAVFCTQVIEHVANFPRLLKEAFRLLKPEGKLFVSGPMYWYLHEEPYDFHRFTKYGLQNALENAGFERIQITPNGGKWSLLGLVLIHTLPRRVQRRKLRYLLNSLFLWLDQRDFNPINTSNYFAAAERSAMPTLSERNEC